MTKVVVIGAGIVGSAAALFLAERGARVIVLERDEIASAASGRNAGSIQHPLDHAATALFTESVEIYKRFGLVQAQARGLLAVTRTESAARAALALASEFPELRPELLDGGVLRRLEPGLAEGLFGCRMDTAYPARPGDATRRFAELARAAGARFIEGAAAGPLIEHDRVVGARTATDSYAADAVLVAAGPWNAELIPGRRIPIDPVWGVTVQIAMQDPVRHRLEEWGEEGAPGGTHFEATPLESVTILGATRTPDEPDRRAFADRVLEMAAEFLPSVAKAEIVAVRSCARPGSGDGRPLLGPIPEIEGLFIAGGHGSLGISLGPGSARAVADAIMNGSPIPDLWRPGREV